MQAAGVSGAAWLGVSVLRLREPGFLLRYWQAVLLVLLLAPWIQPWQPAASTPAHGPPPVGPEREPAGVAGGSVAESVVALPAERWSVDPWTWVRQVPGVRLRGEDDGLELGVGQLAARHDGRWQVRADGGGPVVDGAHGRELDERRRVRPRTLHHDGRGPPRVVRPVVLDGVPPGLPLV